MLFGSTYIGFANEVSVSSRFSDYGNCYGLFFVRSNTNADVRIYECTLILTHTQTLLSRISIFKELS